MYGSCDISTIVYNWIHLWNCVLKGVHNWLCYLRVKVCYNAFHMFWNSNVNKLQNDSREVSQEK